MRALQQRLIPRRALGGRCKAQGSRPLPPCTQVLDLDTGAYLTRCKAVAQRVLVDDVVDIQAADHIAGLKSRPIRRAAGIYIPDQRTMLAGMANPIPMEPPDREKIAVFTPTNRPSMVTSAPPELPGLMAASVWMKNW